MTRNNQRPNDFVIHPNGDFQGKLRMVPLSTHPEVSVIIPTLDGDRNGSLPVLIDQIKKQTFTDLEILIIQGDIRQGRAINLGALMAEGEILITMDDDTRLGHPEVIENMVRAIRNHPDVGIVGVSNVVPKDAPLLTRLVMKQIPRRSSPIVSRMTESDMAEHPCLAITKSLFYHIGGENELIPRGLDPYLRYMVRRAGYRVVVIPNTWIHHLPPSTMSRLIRQFFRNGQGAAFCQKFYPQWVLELSRVHTNPERLQRGMVYRLGRNFILLSVSLVQGRLLYVISQISYLAGFCLGLLRLRQDSV